MSRILKKISLPYIVLLAIVLSFIIALSLGNNNIVFLSILALFLWNIVYCFEDLKGRVLFFAFQITFFTFLLGKLTVRFFSGQTFLDGFSDSILRHIFLCLFLSMLSVFAGFSIFHGKKQSYSTPSAPMQSDLGRFVRDISKVVLYATFAPYMAQIIEKIIFVRNSGYLSYYREFNSAIPFPIKKLGEMCIPALFLFLATMPSKKQCKIPLLLYFLAGVATLGYGQRNGFVLAAALILIYACLRDKIHNDGTVWVSKKMILCIILAMPFLLVFLSLLLYFRMNQMAKFSFFSAITDFFDRQGITVTLLGYGIQYQNDFPAGKFYLFGPIIDFLNNNVISQSLFHFPVYRSQTVDMALLGNSFGQTISYFVNPDQYLAGAGLGSCYIAEAFHDFGYVGVVLVSALYGFILAKSTRIFEKHMFLGAFQLFMVKGILYAPRDAAFTFLTSAFNFINVFTVLGICFFAKALLNLQKKRSTMPHGKSNKILVLINSCFPYDKGESFLENEIPFADGFDKIYLFPCQVENDQTKRIVSNDKIQIIPLKKVTGKGRKLLQSMICLFHPKFWKELRFLMQNGKMNFRTVKFLLSFMQTGMSSTQKIKRQLQKDGFSEESNIVFYSYWMFYHAFAAVSLKKQFPNSKAVSRCHGFDLYEYRNPDHYIPFRQYIIENLDTIFSISEDGKNYIESSYPNFRKNIVVSRLGTMDYGVRTIDTISSPFRIISCSWISPVKRVWKIVDALSQIRDIEIEWTHVGSGQQFESLKKYANKKLGPNIHAVFLGAVSNLDLMRLYQQNDYHLFVNVSESEGIPVSIMEAMSFGIPVVATNVGGVGEIVFDGKSGILIDKDFDNQDLVNAIRDFATMDISVYDAYRNNTRKCWEKKFNAARNFTEFYKILRG
jgi:oligosaccharide repeat unit polymerase